MARILIVDDEVRLGRVLVEMLEGAGHEVAHAAGPGAAVRRLSEGDLDVVVSDLVARCAAPARADARACPLDARACPLDARDGLGGAGTATWILDELLVPQFSLDALERDLIHHALVRAGGNKAAAARLLGITRRRLYSRLDSFGELARDED
jgi:DNA-binding NtrC family response regulator